MLNARRVTFDSCLTLSGDYELPERLGFDDYEAESWEEVTEVLLAGRPLMSIEDWHGNPLDDLLGQAAAEDSSHGGRIYVDDDADAFAVDEPGHDPACHDDDQREFGHAVERGTRDAVPAGFLIDFFIGDAGERDLDASAIQEALSEYMASAEALTGETDDDEDVDCSLGGDGMLRSMSEAPAGRTFFAAHWVGGLQTGVQGPPTTTPNCCSTSLTTRIWASISSTPARSGSASRPLRS